MHWSLDKPKRHQFGKLFDYPIISKDFLCQNTIGIKHSKIQDIVPHQGAL